jgi:hypothetical protein
VFALMHLTSSAWEDLAAVHLTFEKASMERNRRETIAMLAAAAPAALGIRSTFGVTRACAQTTKPNILFILVDNLG